MEERDQPTEPDELPSTSQDDLAPSGADAALARFRLETYLTARCTLQASTARVAFVLGLIATIALYLYAATHIDPRQQVSVPSLLFFVSAIATGAAFVRMLSKRFAAHMHRQTQALLYTTLSERDRAAHVVYMIDPAHPGVDLATATREIEAIKAQLPTSHRAT